MFLLLFRSYHHTIYFHCISISHSYSKCSNELRVLSNTYGCSMVCVLFMLCFAVQTSPSLPPLHFNNCDQIMRKYLIRRTHTHKHKTRYIHQVHVWKMARERRSMNRTHINKHRHTEKYICSYKHTLSYNIYVHCYYYYYYYLIATHENWLINYAYHMYTRVLFIFKQKLIFIFAPSQHSLYRMQISPFCMNI